jgi:hypothetical protein
MLRKRAVKMPLLNSRASVNFALPICLLVSLLPCCEYSVASKKLKSKNPTVYVFNATIPKVRECLKGKGHFKLRDKLFHVAFKEDDSPFARPIFDSEQNKHDAFLYNFHEPIGPSEVYFKGNEPLLYFAHFHIHLERVGPEQTKVEAISVGSKVIHGRKFSIHALGMINDYMDVEPTTIDEYRILLKIGSCVGQEGMPKIIVP